MANELQAVNQAFLEAFDLAKLKRLVSFGLDEELEQISTGDDLTEIVYELTRWAEQEGRIRELITAAQAQSSNPRIARLKAPRQRRAGLLDETDPSSKFLMNQQVTLEILSLRVQQMEKDIAIIRNIVTGPNGDNGVRSLSRENARNLDDIQKMVQSYDEKLANLSLTIAKMETLLGNGPDLFKSTQSKVIFGLIILFLVSIFLVLISGKTGWI